VYQWRAPEEQVDEDGESHKLLDHKIDIYGLGNILFRFAVGSTPWKKPDGSSLTKDEKHELAMIKMKEGASPPIPETRLNTEDPALKALLAAIKLCYSFDPKDRPSAEEITRFLGDAIRDITNE
jgi:serine/threonine protein kinase